MSENTKTIVGEVLEVFADRISELDEEYSTLCIQSFEESSNQWLLKGEMAKCRKEMKRLVWDMRGAIHFNCAQRGLTQDDSRKAIILAAYSLYWGTRNFLAHIIAEILECHSSQVCQVVGSYQFDRSCDRCGMEIVFISRSQRVELMAAWPTDSEGNVRNLCEKCVGLEIHVDTRATDSLTAHDTHSG